VKIILVGHPGSQKIVPISKYLVSKYLPDFDVYYCKHTDPIENWAKNLADLLSSFNDKHIILSLDDYLLSGFDSQQYRLAETYIRYHADVKCIKLCHSTPEEHKEYPCTTQYTIWDRDYLIWLLVQIKLPIKTPWEFEMLGSQLMKESMQVPCIEYFTNSSLSAKWEGINWTGVKEEDLNYIKANGLI
jgi:hypothetical protein